MARTSQAKRAAPHRYRRGVPGDYTERNRKICELRATTDLSLKAIGATCNPVLSRETVRLIIRHAERRAAARNSEKMVKLRAAFASGVTGRD